MTEPKQPADPAMTRHQLGAQPSRSGGALIYRRLTVSDCLHCDINELVRARLEQSEMIDLPELAGKMAESLVDLILLAPEAQQGQMLAEAISQLGNAFLEKSGVEGESDTEH
jgi:hypothetical protein